MHFTIAISVPLKVNVRLCNKYDINKLTHEHKVVKLIQLVSTKCIYVYKMFKVTMIKYVKYRV